MKEKLQAAVNQKFLGIVKKKLNQNSSLDKALREWNEFCVAIGLERSHEIGDNRVSVTDPSPGGAYLLMDQEKATLILTVGLP